MALTTEHHKENRNLNQQNANWTHIVNPPVRDEEGDPLYAPVPFCGTPLTINHIIFEYLIFETDKREAGVPNILRSHPSRKHKKHNYINNN